jgi:hypothetical protein
MAEAEAEFWALAPPLLEHAGVTRSTMMGSPCLRLDGDFFASWDPKHGRLIVKLDAATVTESIDAEEAEPFAPAGGRFREWAAIPTDRSASSNRLLE